MLLWNGACMVHEIFSLEKITRLKVRHPEGKTDLPPRVRRASFAYMRLYRLNHAVARLCEQEPCKRVYRGNRGRYNPPDGKAGSGQDFYSGTTR